MFSVLLLYLTQNVFRKSVFVLNPLVSPSWISRRNTHSLPTRHIRATVYPHVHKEPLPRTFLSPWTSGRGGKKNLLVKGRCQIQSLITRLGIHVPWDEDCFGSLEWRGGLFIWVVLFFVLMLMWRRGTKTQAADARSLRIWFFSAVFVGSRWFKRTNDVYYKEPCSLSESRSQLRGQGSESKEQSWGMGSVPDNLQYLSTSRFTYKPTVYFNLKPSKA